MHEWVYEETGVRIDKPGAGEAMVWQIVVSPEERAATPPIRTCCFDDCVSV